MTGRNLNPDATDRRRAVFAPAPAPMTDRLAARPHERPGRARAATPRAAAVLATGPSGGAA